jgi:hypothetical protein
MEGISLSRRLLLEGVSESEGEAAVRTREQGVDDSVSVQPVAQP